MIKVTYYVFIVVKIKRQIYPQIVTLLVSTYIFHRYNESRFRRWNAFRCFRSEMLRSSYHVSSVGQTI